MLYEVITVIVHITVWMAKDALTVPVAALFRQGHPAVWFDVRRVMRTDSLFGKATPAIEALRTLSQQELAPLLAEHIVITQGFIGANRNNFV